MTALAVLLAGGVGAFGRYWVIGWVQRLVRDPRPWGTAVVNLSGALAAGVVAGLVTARGLDAWWIQPATLGFLGGYTTFSTWMVETLYLAEEAGRVGVRNGAINLVGTLVGGLLLAAAGFAIGKVI